MSDHNGFDQIAGPAVLFHLTLGTGGTTGHGEIEWIELASVARSTHDRRDDYRPSRQRSSRRLLAARKRRVFVARLLYGDRGLHMMEITGLADAVDKVNEGHFWGRTLPEDERTALARSIVARQGLPHAYGKWLFAPTDRDRTADVRTFTGEALRSNAVRRHVLGEEAARVLRLLQVPLPEIQAATERASEGMAMFLQQRMDVNQGVYCCGTCTTGVWRHMAVGGMAPLEPWLSVSLASLRALRVGDGSWRRFPFWYTISALVELDVPGVTGELAYAAHRLETASRRQTGDDLYRQRRGALAERALSRI